MDGFGVTMLEVLGVIVLIAFAPWIGLIACPIVALVIFMPRKKENKEAREVRVCKAKKWLKWGLISAISLVIYIGAILVYTFATWQH